MRRPARRLLAARGRVVYRPDTNLSLEDGDHYANAVIGTTSTRTQAQSLSDADEPPAQNWGARSSGTRDLLLPPTPAPRRSAA